MISNAKVIEWSVNITTKCETNDNQNLGPFFQLKPVFLIIKKNEWSENKFTLLENS